MEVAAIVRSTCDADTFKGKVGARTITTQDVVIRSFCIGSPAHILKKDILYDDSVCRSSSRTAVEVVFLDVQTINGSI